MGIEDADREVAESSHPSYFEALPRYLTALDPAFERAREVSEFNFLLSIFAVRGMQDAGWDPYETTVRAIGAIRDVHRQIDGEANRHLALWLYGHIVEASEPYEFLSNLIDIAGGGAYKSDRFPPRTNGVPLSPQTKIARLEAQAKAAGMSDVILPMSEVWSRDFRNAMFHADYSLHGSEVRTIRPTRAYSHDAVMTLVNRALAYHEAMTLLRKTHVESYTEPKRIPADPEFTRTTGEQAVVIVRQQYGATGLKDGYTAEQLKRGYIPYQLGRFSREEMDLLDSDPMLALLPPRKS